MEQPITLKTILFYTPEIFSNITSNLTEVEKLSLVKSGICDEYIGNYNIEELLNFKKETKEKKSYYEIESKEELISKINEYGYKNIKYIKIEDIKTTKIPNIIYRLKNVEYLNLCNNEISRISENIVNLNNLEHLNLSNNKLITLPENIVNLVKLDYLKIVNNKLTTIPENIGNLVKLEYLYLAYNNLTVIPERL